MSTSEKPKGTVVSVTAPWLRLIAFVRNQVPYGEVTFKVIGGEPSSLTSAKQNIRFDRPLPSTVVPLTELEGEVGE